MSIKENYDEIMEKVENAAIKSGRKLSDITVIGVSKTVDIDKIKTLNSLGINHFGENKVQEFLEKHHKLNTNWHFIGHLQTNKVKYIVDKVGLIHSVDSIKLAKEINKQSIKNNVISDVLVEINIAKEESKHGIFVENVENLIESMLDLQNINIKGLMCIPPYVEKGEKNRKFFYEIFEKSVDILQKYPHNVNMDVLSMGMSDDYEVAILEGANCVRIGRKFFGARNN